MSIKRPTLFFFFAFLSFVLVGQVNDSIIYVYGTVLNEDTKLPIQNASILIKSKGDKKLKIQPDQEGHYELHLHSNRNYRIKVFGKGIVSKNVIINSQNIPEESKASGFTMEMDWVLFEKIKGQKFPFLKKAMSTCKYDPEADNLAWDFEKINENKAKIEEIRNRN